VLGRKHFDALSGHGFRGCEKKQNRRHSEEPAAAGDEESLFLLGNRARGIPHFVRNDAAEAFFRNLFNRAASEANSTRLQPLRFGFAHSRFKLALSHAVSKRSPDRIYFARENRIVRECV